MTDSIFDIITTYGIWGVFICTYLSCLLVPLPTSLILLASGSLIASGDISAWSLWTAAFIGAALGDQTGYFLGRTAGQRVLKRLSRHPARAKIITRAQETVNKRGGIGVFLSTWLFAPLSPYVNIVSGAANLSWFRFTIADLAGEVIWVSAYVGMGYAFAGSLTAVADIAGNVIGVLVGLGLASIAGIWIALTMRAPKNAAESGELPSHTAEPHA